MAAALLLSGCALFGPERSVEAYCDLYKERAAEMEAKYSDRAEGLGQNEDEVLSDLLVGLGSLMEAQGDLAAAYEDLSEVAPPEIENDVERMATALRKQADTVAEMGSDPLGAALGSTMTGLQNMGAAQNVAEFEQQNCV